MGIFDKTPMRIVFYRVKVSQQTCLRVGPPSDASCALKIVLILTELTSRILISLPISIVGVHYAPVLTLKRNQRLQYSDNPASRTLAAATFTDTQAMSVEACITFCNQGGFIFAGVEFAQECCTCLYSSMKCL